MSESLLALLLACSVVSLQPLGQRLQLVRLHLCAGVVTKPLHPQLPHTDTHHVVMLQKSVHYSLFFLAADVKKTYFLEDATITIMIIAVVFNTGHFSSGPKLIKVAFMPESF